MADITHPTVIDDQRTIPDFPSGMEVRQISKEIIVVDRENCPFSSHLLYDDMGKHEIKGEQYQHFEQEHEPFRFEMGATPSNPTTDTDLTITGSKNWLLPGDRLMATDGINIETIFCHTEPTADNGDFYTRSTGDSTAVSLAKGDELVKMGSAHQEASSAPDARMTKEVASTWFIQIDRKTTQITKHAANREVIGGNPRLRAQALKTDEWKRGMELSLLLGFGALNIYSSGTTRTGASKSVVQHISTYSYDMPIFSLAGLEAGLEGPARRHGSANGWDLLCSPRVYGAIYNMYRAQLYSEDDEDQNKRYGAKIKVLETQHGPVRIVREPMLGFGSLQELSIAHPHPITSFSKVLQWNWDNRGVGAHWVFDIDTNKNPSWHMDEILGGYGYWGTEEARFTMFLNTQR